MMDGVNKTDRADAVDRLMSDLAGRDIRLKIVDGRLGYDAPPDAFTATLKAEVQALRSELIVRLSAAASIVVAPLSCGQERMWYLNRLEIQSAGGAGSYTEHLAYALNGPLDRQALEGALAAVVARHGTLRCRFRDGAEGPEQVVTPPAPATLPVIDLAATPERLDGTLEAAAQRPIDLASDDHVRFTLLVCGDDRHVLSVSAHHAAWDGWSNGVFAADLAVAYNALRAGRTPSLPPLARQVADLAREQRRALAAGRFDAPLGRLCHCLAGFPTRLDLPADRARAKVACGIGAAIPLRVESDVAAALAAAGRKAGVTPAMTLLAVFALLLSRLSGADRLLIGAPVAARDDAVAEALIGYLSNTVAIPVDVGQADSFGALAVQVRDTVLEVMASQHVPFEKLVEALAPPRSRATTPLVQAVFAMQPRTTAAPDLDGLGVEVLPSHNHGARYELMLNLQTTGDGALEGPLTYAAALFDGATVERWKNDFLALVAAVPDIWDRPLESTASLVSSSLFRFARKQRISGTGVPAGGKDSAALRRTPAGTPVPLHHFIPCGSAAGRCGTRNDEGVVVPVEAPTPPAGEGFVTATERALAVIWGEFLQTAPTDRHDDFFVLGGHSLLLMRVVNRINTTNLGRIALVDALGATTLAAMAARIDGQAAGVPPAPPVDSGDYPATASQEGMWLTRRDDPNSVSWAVPLLIDVTRHAEPVLVRIALERLAARHPSLRTILAERDGAVIQRVAPPGQVALVVHQGLDAAGRVAVMRRELAHPTDFEHGPLYRFHLFADGGTGGEAGALFIVADHSVIDGWSLDVLRRDFIALLDAAASDGHADLPVLTLSPADVAAQHLQTLAGPRGAELRRYWLETLDGLDLGEGFAPGRRPPGAGRRGRRTMVAVSATAASALDQSATAQSTTPTVVFLAALAVLLARVKGGGREVSVATPFAGRPGPELADLVGCFVEVLPLRLSCSPDQSFARHLAATRRTLLGALAHEDYPLRRLSDDWTRARGGEPQALYDAVAVIEEAPRQLRDWFTPQLGAGKYDLAFIYSRLSEADGGGAVLTIEHDEWLFSVDDARDLAARLDVLLIDAAARPEVALGDLALLPDAELRLVTTDFNRTAVSYPRDVSLATLWRRAAEQHATRTAVIGADGTRTSYAALDRWAEELVGGLLAKGAVGPTVALAMERGPAAIAAILAIWKVGAAYLPLTAKLPLAAVAQLMADAEASVILGDAKEMARLAGLPGVTILRLADLATAAAPPPPVTNGDSTAYVMYTSGTTGQPKGVMVSHRAIARLALAEARVRLSPGDVMAQTAPLAFDATTLEIWSALLNGAALRIVADEELHEPPAFGAALRRDGVTAMWLTAAQFNRVADEAPAALASLRWVATGGEVLSPPHLRRVLAACPGTTLLNGYGPTENTCITTFHAIAPADLDGAVPIGTPVANSRVYIVDERLTPVPIGVWGELVCAGDGLALGYAGRPDLTAAAFVTLPWGAERVYRSGDIARWRRDGVIEFQGRRDGQVKIRGQRIETAAIEATLSAFPGVRDAAVVVDSEGADKALVACVLADDASGPPLDADGAARREKAWRLHLAERLPLYMMPARFLVLPGLPMNANGKRDLRALSALVAAAHPVSSVEVKRPETEAERLVARLFGQLFPGTAIDRESDFFHLGGHSLLAMRLSAQLEAESGTRIPMRALFAARTVTAIAGLLDGANLPPMSLHKKKTPHMRGTGAPAQRRSLKPSPLMGEGLGGGDDVANTWVVSARMALSQKRDMRTFPLCKKVIVDIPAIGQCLTSPPPNPPPSRGRAYPSAYSPTRNDDKEGEATPQDYPLSSGQERLWVMQRLFPESAVYNVPLVFVVEGELDTGAFAKALLALEERHHGLRLRVDDDAGRGLRQHLTPAGGLRPQVIDLSDAADPAVAADVRMSEEGAHPFRLKNENGARAVLMRLGPSRWRVLLLLHHAICDGWSVAILMRDLAAFYGRETDHAGSLPPAPKLQFQDVALWQRRLLDSPEGQALLGRWVARLTPLPEPLPFPADRRRPPIRSFRGNADSFAFDPARSAALDRLARAEAATPFALVTALVQVLLFRMTGKTDLVLGTLVGGRDRPEVEDTVGFLVNTLVLRQTIDAAVGFTDHLAATREVCLQAVADQHCPFEALVEALGVPRDLGHNPLFDVLVVWQQEDSPPPDLAGLTTHGLSYSVPFSKFDLAFHFGRRDERIICQIEYSTDLFDAETIAALFARLDVLTAALLADPRRPLAVQPILPEDERVLVVERFNATRRTFDTQRTLLRPFLDQVATGPDRPALIWDGGTLDYRRFAGLAGGVARRLVAAGVRPGDTVAVCAPRSPELLAAIYGILMSGAAYAPLGADHPAARLGAMLEDLGRPIVLAAPECRALVAGAAGRVLALATGEEAEPRDFGSSDGLAYVMFTSGSTGRPKGVAIEQHSVLNRLLWAQATLPIGPGDVILQKTPVTFDVSIPELFWWAVGGASVALPPLGAERDPTALAGLIERHGVTHAHFVPSMLAAFLACVEDGRIEAGRLTRLRQVFSSGEALQPSLIAQFDRLLYRPQGIRLHNLYGPTEATVEVTWQCCSPWMGEDMVSIGAPIANTTLYILDGDGNPAPIGVTGEIHLGGSQVARGYVNRPDLTREKFLPDPFVAGGRLYRTGDRGRWRRDGTVDFLDRIDDQVKIRGQRIEPGEVERALESHPAVERAVVVAATSTQGLTELHGYVALRSAVGAGVLQAYLRDRVTEAMIPVRLFRLDSVPLTVNGKLDRKMLVGVSLDGAAPAPVAAGGAIEAEVRAIWKSILPAADPEATDGFFEVGGTSLLVIHLHERLDARWPGRFTVTDLFACATIADQVRRIAGEVEATPGKGKKNSGTGLRADTEKYPLAPCGRGGERSEEVRGLTRVKRGNNVLKQASLDGAPTRAPLTRSLTLAALSRKGRGLIRAEPGATDSSIKPHAVAIVGMAVRLSGSDDLAGFWRDVSTGADRVRALPAMREADARFLSAILDQAPPARFREGGYLDDVFGFDPQRFRMSPADASLLDPEQRLFLDTALRALENAGRGGSALDRARVGVFVGGGPDSAWRDAVMRGAEPGRFEQISALNVPSNVATRLSYLHDWRGPAAVIDTACSASLVALHQGCQALASGACDWVLVGGAKVVLIPPAADERLAIYSRSGRTHAFAEGADGTGIGEGAVVFLLRPLAGALADNDAIHAVILGSAVNQDGASSGMAAPNPAAQGEVIRAAAEDAGVALSSLSYIEAHGTGTALGDPVEIDGLTRAFAPETGTDGAALAAIGSAKGNYGHLDGAAGALGLARAVMSLAHDRAPPQPFFDRPNPRIDFGRAPVAVSRVLAPLADRGGPRRAGVSAFGLSGINAHVIIEAAPPWHAVERPFAWTAVGISAPDAESLHRYAEAIVLSLRQHPEWPLANIACTLTEGREPLAARLGIAVRDRGDLMSRLAVFAAAPEAASALVVSGTVDRNRDQPVVVAVTPDEETAVAAAHAFVGGARLAWPETAPAGRVPLPAAPLARRRLMPALTLRAASHGGLLAPAVVTAQGRFHTIDVHAPDFWPAAEHRLNGMPTLVGMAFPALLAEAHPDAFSIRGLRWIRPLRPDTLERGTVTLTLAADGAASLDGRTTDGRWQSFAAATIGEGGDDRAPERSHDASAPLSAGSSAARDSGPGAVVPLQALRIDIEAIGRRCSAPVETPDFEGDNGTVTVSERWNCLERVAVGTDESLVWLCTPGGDGVPLRLHPALLDVAAGQALDVLGLVPTGCDEIRIIAPLSPNPVAHVVRRRHGTDGIEADLWLADRETGSVGLTIRGLRFTPIGSGPAVADIVPSVPVWRDHPQAVPTLDTSVVVIGEGALAERIAAHLATTGRLAGRAGSDVVDDDILAAIGAIDGPAIVLAPSGPDIGSRAAAAMRAILTALRHPTRLLGLGEGAFAIGDDGPLDPDQALVYGILSAVAHEEPLLHCRYVDADDATGPAALLGELAAAADKTQHAIAWRAGRRLLRAFVPIPEPSRAIPWPQHGCCVVTGGIGGLSLLLAETLANDRRVALALLSRSGMPQGSDPEAVRRRQALADLHAAGLRVETYACDVADGAALAATLDRIRRDLGPITAVVHNAGVPDGAVLMQANRSADDHARLIAGKVTGARLLDALTEDDPVEAFVMAGSLTALVGGAGQSAYTGANAFLDAFAALRRRRGKPGLTIDWCLIRGMGMAARLIGTGSTQVPSIGAGLVGPLLLRSLAADAPQVALLDPAVAGAMAEPAPPIVIPPVATVSAAIAPEGAVPGDAPLETALAATWAAVLGYESVGPDDDFYALGGDSISAMQIVERAVRVLGLSMTLVDLFDAGTVSALVARLRGRAGSLPSEAPGPRPAPHADRYPLAWEQLAVLRAEAKADMATAHNLPQGLQLPEDIDLPRLRHAVDLLFARHDILRTRFVPPAAAGDEPMMEILPPAPVVIEALDRASDDALGAAMKDWVRPFDLWAGVPVRIVLGSIAGHPRVLVLDVHHALADAFTMELLLADLTALYAGTIGPAPVLQLKDYAWWVRKGEGAGGHDASRAYWHDRFRGTLPTFDLPLSHPRPRQRSWRAEYVEFTVPFATVLRLRSAATTWRTTPFTLVTAAWALLLTQAAGQEEMVIAVPFNVRQHSGMAAMAGMLVSLLPLRLAVHAADSVSELIARTQATYADALRHRDYDLGRLLADLSPPPAPDRPSLAEVQLSYMNFAENAGQRPTDSGLVPIWITRREGKSDLGIYVRDLPDQMVMAIEYACALFDRDGVEALGHRFCRLLDALTVAAADYPVQSLLAVAPAAAAS